MWKEACWLRVPAEEIKSKEIFEGDLNGRFAWFRCGINAPFDGRLKILISAVSRYRLWVNGAPVHSGPLRGDRYRQYYDELDLSTYLKEGQNTILVKVLYGNPYSVFSQHEERTPLFSLTSAPACSQLLAVEGDIRTKDGEYAGTVTTGKAPWQVTLDNSFYLLAGDAATANLGAVRENINVEEQRKAIAYVEAERAGSVVPDIIDRSVGFLGHFVMTPRDIPLMAEEEGRFSEETVRAFGQTEEPASEGQVSQEGQPASEDQISREGQPASEGQVSQEGQPASEDQISQEGQPASEDQISREGQPASEGQVSQEGQPASEGQVSREGQPASEDQISREGQPASEDQIPQEGHPPAGSQPAAHAPAFRIPPHEEKSFLLDPQFHINAYMQYYFTSGRNASVTLLYSEKFESLDGTTEIQRDDREHGILKGLVDTLVLDGNPFVYEPFWFRTFRFILLTVRTKEEAAVVYLPRFFKTGYPLQTVTRLSSEDPGAEQLFAICERTLRNCMMETYMDCPFYEQMQFPMDTRLQMLFTYAVSRDTRLAKKALLDFHSSMIPDGLIQGKAPCAFTEVITTFSLYYIFALAEYYEYTKDLDLICRYRADVDMILEYYHRHIGDDGLVKDLDYWPFVDWQSAWGDNFGRPNACRQGSSSIINLMYALALKKGAFIYRETGRPGMAEEYLERSSSIITKIKELCYDEDKGLLMEGPGFKEYSQHAQSWAVLNGMFGKEEAAEILRRTLADPEVIQCSFSTGYEVFRAFEEAGIYGEVKPLWDRWLRLIALHCTTCPEEPGKGRSECHAWSALPLYEMVRVMAGIRPENPGWGRIVIRPDLSLVPSLKGTVCLPKGEVRIDYRKDPEEYRIWLPEGTEAVFEWQSGKREALYAGLNVVSQGDRFLDSH